MIDTHAKNTMISKFLWRYDGVRDGHPDLSSEPINTLLAAYVALTMKRVDAPDANWDSSARVVNDESLVSLLQRGRVPSEVRDYLVDSFDEYWQDVSRNLAREFDSDALRSFVLSDDFFTFEIGRNSGEFTTPECLRKLSLKILDISDGDDVADLCCGGGGLLTDIAMSENGAQLVGIEQNHQGVALSVARLDLLGANYDIRCGDVLAEPVVRRFSKVFSNYPFGFRVVSMRSGGNFFDSLRSGNMAFGRPASGDWAFNLRCLDYLGDDGKAVVIMSNGATFNGGDEQARKYFVDNGMIRAVVALPAKLFTFTNISTTLVVLGHNDGNIRMVDATDLSITGRRVDTMGDDEIAEVISRLESDSLESVLVDKGALAHNEYVLYPPRYLRRDIAMINATPLGKLAEIERGASLNAKELDFLITDEDTGISFLRLSDISDGIVGRDLPRLSGLDEKLRAKCLHAGDLVLSKNGAPFKVAVVDVQEGQTILANGNLYIIRLDAEKVDPYFIAAFLSSEDGKESLSGLVVGTTLPNLPLKNLKEMEIPVPPQIDQKAVADIYRARLDEIEVGRIRIKKALLGASTAYDEVMGR